MQAQTVIRLTEEQIKTTLNNLWDLRKVKLEKKIFQGKPIFSKEIMTKYKYKHYTKFADNYEIFQCKSKVDGHNEIYITVETDHYDKQNLLAISGFEHLITEFITESCNYVRPTINICLCFVLTKAMKKHIPTEIFANTAFVRVFSLCSIYPMLGSKNKQFGLTFDYKLYPYEKAYNDKDYTEISSGDPMVIALNGLPGELVVCSRILFDTTAYKDIQIRKIVDKIKNLSTVSKSGILLPISSNNLEIVEDV